MNLGDLITRLEAADPGQTVRHGFTNPHSYRGDYMDLAFEPAENRTVADMLSDARSALGATYQGWKGGDFTMDEHTWCWLSVEGDASGETISPLLLEYMLTAPAVLPVPSAPTSDQAGLREQVADVLADADGWTWAPGFDRRRSPAYQAYLTRADRVVGLLTAYDTTRADARVRALHQQYTFGTDAQDYCAHCNQISGGWIPWPCPTVQALDAAGAQQPEPETAERPRCPHCQMPHDLTPGVELACASIRASIRDAGAQQPECTASTSGTCLREAQSETACDTEGGECVHGGRPAGAQQQPTTETPRRCAHTDIVYGRCVLTVPHDSECVHEHQPRCAMPSSDRQHSCVLPPNHEGPHADKHLADVVPNGGRTIWQTPLSAPAPEPLSPVEAAGARHCPAKHGALGRICELPAGHQGMHTGSSPNGGAVWDGDAS